MHEGCGQDSDAARGEAKCCISAETNTPSAIIPVLHKQTVLLQDLQRSCTTKRKAEVVADQSNSLLVTCIKPSTHWIGQRLLPLFASWCKKLVCSTTACHCCWIFVPRQLFLEVKRTSVSAHRAIFSHRLQYGNHRMGGAIDTPTQSATKHPLNYGIGNESCELNHLIQTSVAVNAVLISTWKVSFDLATERTFGCI